MDSLPSIHLPTSPSTQSLQSGVTLSPPAQESPRLLRTQMQRRSLDQIENDPFPDARIWNMKASDLEKWRQVLSHAKRRLYK